MNKKLLVLGLLPIMLLSGCSSSKRVEQANNFKTNVLAENYSLALSDTVLGDYDYLSSDRFKDVLKATGWIDFLKSSGSFKKSRYNKDIMVEELSTENGQTITVQLDSQDRFDMSDWYIEDVSILVPTSSTLSIDNQIIDKEYVTSSIDGIDTYELPMLFNTVLDFETTNPVLGTVTKEIEPSDEIIDMTFINEDSLQLLIDTLEAKVNILYSAVVNNYDAQGLMNELPCIKSVEQAEDILTRMKSNQRIEDVYIGYTSIYASVESAGNPKFIDENELKLPLKLLISFNMGTKPCTQIITQDFYIDNTGQISSDTDLSFMYSLVYSEEGSNNAF